MVVLQIRRAPVTELGDGWRAHLELRSDTEDCMNELPLRYWIALGDPSDLTFADGMHRLVPLNCSARTFYGSEPEARRNAFFNEPMVLLDDVVQIRCGSAAT